jgi:hypothetical protein
VAVALAVALALAGPARARAGRRPHALVFLIGWKCITSSGHHHNTQPRSEPTQLASDPASTPYYEISLLVEVVEVVCGCGSAGGVVAAATS